MKKLISIFGTIVALLMLVPLGMPMQAEASPMQAVNVPAQDGGLRWQTAYASTNWSGYAVTGSNATYVTGSWVVPPVTPSTNSTYSAAWVGIDGFVSSTVEQIGTMQEYSGTTASYYAWYEMYPSGMITLPNTVKAGDAMTATVSYITGNEFYLTLKDSTQHWTFGPTEIAANAQPDMQASQDNSNPVENYDSQLFNRSIKRTQGPQRSSVEWIMEAPSSGSRVLPLADFGTITFSGATASINGDANTPISKYNYDTVTMVTNTNIIKANPSALSTDGESFTITWQHN